MKLLKGIRKFGLEYCDLPTMMWNISILSRLLLLNIDSRFTKPIFIMYIITPLAVWCYFYTFTLSGLWFVMVRSVETGDIIYGRVVLALSITSQIVSVKLFFLFLNRSNVKKLVDDYIAYDALLDQKSRFYKNLLKKLRTVKKRGICLWTILVTNGAIYLIKPLIKPGRNPVDEFPLYGLEPTLETPYYEINYAVMTLSVIFCLHVPITISGFIIVITGYIESQMVSLGEELQAIWSDAEQHYKNSILTSNHEVVTADYNEDVIKNVYIGQELKIILKMHTANITLLRQTERVFRNALAGEFIILIMSLIAVLVGGLEYTYIQIPFGFSQVALDCFAGQNVIDAGVSFEHAIYDSKWEKFDVRNRKTILIMLMNSQKTLKLSAGGIATLNFPCLMTVIRCVYSAYTTLRSTIQKH